MIYLRIFDSHSDYEKEASSLISPNVSWDREHVHFSSNGSTEIVYLYMGLDSEGNTVMAKDKAELKTPMSKYAIVDKSKKYNIVYTVEKDGESHTVNHYNVGCGDILSMYSTDGYAESGAIFEITQDWVDNLSILSGHLGEALAQLDSYNGKKNVTGTIEYNIDGDYVTTMVICRYIGDEPSLVTESYKVEDYKELYIDCSNFDGNIAEEVYFFFNKDKRVDIVTQNITNKYNLLNGFNKGLGDEITGDEYYGYTTKIAECNEDWEYYTPGITSFKGYGVLMPFKYDLLADEFTINFKTLAD